MPHCILEYSNNITDKFNQRKLLLDINKFLAKSFSVDIINIKSRVNVRENFLVSTGDKDQAFIHLTILLLSGREKVRLKKLSSDFNLFLREKFKLTLNDLPTSLTVEVREMDRDLYTKELFGEL